MNIAIQGHPSRGEEVIKTLNSLGGENTRGFFGNSKNYYYFVNKYKIIDRILKYKNLDNYKCYTLEEFEKEFPFKPGDTVIDKDGDEGCIEHLGNVNGHFYYSVKYNYNQFAVYPPKSLKLKKKEMNTRNITLTLDKAKEWYKQGGDLKEVALQAFTKEELTPLPKSWEEYCKMYNVTVTTNIFGPCIPIKYIALWKLEQLRDCYRQGWTLKPKECACVIKYANKGLNIYYYSSQEFLSFQSREIAEEFLKNFESLIKEAGDLI